MKSIWIKAGAVALLFAALALRIYLYVMGGLHIPVTTDEALTVLQALDILNGDFPLLLAAQPYMFPVEAYWMAPFVHLLPRDGFGMRALILFEGLAATMLGLMVLRRMGGIRATWPGALLILFPSAYLAMNSAAYSLPHNISAVIFSLLAAWCIFGLNRPPAQHDGWLALGGGLFAALAFSNAMFSLALVAPLALIAAWSSIGPGRWRRIPAYTFGAAIGLTPHLLARWLMPGAHESVTASHAWADALTRWWSPTLSETLPVTFGWKPVLFPDYSHHIEWGMTGFRAFPFVMTGLIAAAVGVALIRLLAHWRAGERHDLGAFEWGIGVTMLCCLMFMMTKRASPSSFRYLLPVVVAFPYLITGLWLATPQRVRAVPALFVAILVIYNIATSVRVPLEWRRPDFASHVVSAPDVAPAIDFLRERGIRHAVAAHWAAYRIGFYADGDVVCSQPQNERFPGWPIPYKEEVDAATNVAYVLTERIRFLKPSVFERHLRTMGVEANVHTAGMFKIYTDFRVPAYGNDQPVAARRLTATVSEARERERFLLDGDRRSFWHSERPQQPGQAIELMLDEPTDISRLVIEHGAFAHDRAKALTIQIRRDGEWITWKEAIPGEDDKFAWRNSHPIYGFAQQTYLLQEPRVEAIRLQLADESTWHWTVAEISLYEHP